MNTDALSNNSGGSSQGKRRFPFRTFPVTPSAHLRMLLLKASDKTGRPVKELFHDLLLRAIGEPIHWIVVQPQCDSGAGVALDKVNEALEKAYFFLRDAKGVVSRGSFEEQRKKVVEVEGKALELWAHVQSLASKTFYSYAQIQIGRTVYAEMVRSLALVQKQETEETAKKEKADTKALDGFRARIAKYQTVIDMLARLGFSPEGPQNTD